MATYKQLNLKKRPAPGEKLSIDNYEVVTVPLPTQDQLGNGEILVKITHLSCDPTLRIWASDAKQYMPPVKIGEKMRAIGLGKIEASKNPNFAVGEWVTGIVGWTEYLQGHPQLLGLSKDPTNGNAEVCLGPCGLTGWTAYFGLYDVAKPKPGDNVLVSGAAGATGSMVVQLAKLAGCRVVGIAGGAEKCKSVKELYGADEVIDYKKEDLKTRIKELSGNGYDIFFDNVGGETLNAALGSLALNARVAICGSISEYNSAEKTGPANYLMLLMQRASMQGFIVTDYKDRVPTAIGRLVQWVKSGQVKYESDVQTAPIEKAVDVLNRLFDGSNKGKQIHKLA